MIQKPPIYSSTESREMQNWFQRVLRALNYMTEITSGGATDISMTSTGGTQFKVAHTASAVNYLQATGAATGVAPVLSAQGSDTNIDLTLTPKGSGVVQFGTHSAIGAETVTGYITIKDSGGTSRKIAVVS